MGGAWHGFQDRIDDGSARTDGSAVPSLARAEWVPYALTWDADSGEFRGVEGPRGFASYVAALEASRFLTLTT